MKKMLAVLLLFAALPCAFAQTLPYRDATLPVSQRVEDLLARMTLEEKAGQLRVTLGWNYHERVGAGVPGGEDGVRLTDSFRKEVISEGVGMIWGAFRADPWTQKSLDSGLSPVLAARAANLMQKAAVEETRLGIPLFLAEEAPHGHMAIGATVFPTGIGLAASFSPALLERVGRVVGQEVRASGGHVSYGPVMDLSRDPRWSRVEETLGEDPYLSGEMGAALVRGMGGGRLSEPGSVVATLKHFIAYGATEGGHNGSQTVLGPRVLREDFLPPFRKAVEAGALSVMTAYNSLDGIPNTSNAELLTDVLRGEWGFNGFVVSDLYAVDGLVLFNRFLQPRMDISKLAVVPGVSLSTADEAHLPRAWIATLRNRTTASLAATSGVATAGDVIAYLLAGADVVMTTSALVRKGVGYADELLADMQEWMTRRGFASVAEMRGKLAMSTEADGDFAARSDYVAALEKAQITYGSAIR